MNRGETSRRRLTAALFFCSGFCGLLYQVVWLRLAFAHFGVITPIVSVVVSVFMLGLGLGSWWGGRLADGGGTLSSAYPYALTEAIIGIGAWAVPAFYAWGDQTFLTAGLSSSQAFLRSSLVVGVSLLPWCTAMGATFPLMMNYLKAWPDHERSFSFLYAANVMGACCGAALTAVVLVECLGFHRTLALAGGLNFLIAALALTLLPAAPVAAAREEIPTAAPAAPPAPEISKLLSVLFVTGAAAMALEIVWIRTFTEVLKTSIYAFAAVLCVYLLANWLGTLWYRRRAPADRAPLIGRTLLWLAVFATLPVAAMSLPMKHNNAFLVLSSIVPICFGWGVLTPQVLDRVAKGDPRAAGRAYGINIAGCIVGPLLAGYGLLPFMSAKAAALLFAFLLAATALGEFWRELPKVLLIPALAVLAGATALPNLESRNLRYDPNLWVRRDATATVLAGGEGMSKFLVVNGVNLTALTPITKMMAHIPLAIMDHRPSRALVICFGMGTTFRSLLTWNVPTTAVELVPSVKRCFPYFYDDASQVLANPLGRIVIDDGRRYLRNTTDRYGLITLDPPPPLESASSSLLYSQQFYVLAKKHLLPGGIVEQWFPTGDLQSFRAIAQSIQAEFPYVRIFNSVTGWGYHFLASEKPIVIPADDVFWSRLPPAARRDFMEWFPGASHETIVRKLFSRELPMAAVLPKDPACRVTDDRPFNEYFLLRRWRDEWHGRYKEIY